MAQKIIYENNDGGISIVHPTGELSIEEVVKKDIPSGVNYKIVDESVIPADPTFRDAWEGLETISVNISKAKEITKNKLRNERLPKLQALDIAFQRALESGADLTDISNKKQQLRDATSQVDAMTTVEQLKAAKLPDVGV
jgi:hypothetical protein